MCHPPMCEIWRSRGLHYSGQLWFCPIPEIEIWFTLRLVLLSWLQTGWLAAQSQKSDRQVSRESDRLAGGPPSIFLLKGTGLSREAIFCLPRPAVSWVMKSAIGRTQFFDCEKSCNDSLRPQHWVRDVGFAAGESWSVALASCGLLAVGTWGWWLNLSKPMLLPLQTKDLASALLLVLWGLKETMYAKSLAWGPPLQSNCWINSSC